MSGDLSTRFHLLSKEEVQRIAALAIELRAWIDLMKQLGVEIHGQLINGARVMPRACAEYARDLMFDEGIISKASVREHGDGVVLDIVLA